jgi:toxin ParE1/3/4
VAPHRWDVILSWPARQDFQTIIAWTADTFGRAQANSYRATLIAALRRLEGGPTVLGTLARDEIGRGRRTLHVNRTGGRGRHVILFETRDNGIVNVLRILHDAMDLPRHIPPSELQEDAMPFAP